MIDPSDFAPGWIERIAEAQDDAQIEICGVEYDRIAYGSDYPNGKPRCRDCGVSHGQLHVVGCCVERCAKCGAGQACTGCCDVPAPTRH